MKYFLLALSAVIIVTSCNKEQTLDVPLTRTQMLYGSNTTNGAEAMPSKWKTKEYKVIFTLDDGRDSAVTDRYPECKKDDFLQFFENFTGTHTTADNKCSQNEGDLYRFRWEFSENETFINFYNCDRFFDYRTFIVEIADFSESSFKLKYKEPYLVNNVPVDTVKIEHTLEKF